jgi:hypothetical protein
MKFHVNQIRLWLKNGQIRELNFLPNKVNVITGKSGTGKSSVITIIDYCLVGSESRPVEEVINENVDWYGLKFKINGKDFFIARGRVIEEVSSNQIYFSSTGVIPDVPKPTIEIPELRSILEQEFSVDNNLIIPYGGKSIRAGSKISFRYFMLFNTQSSNIILNPNVFFDYDLYDSQKYREALDRIFDLAIGVDSIDNVLIKEKMGNVEKEILKLEKKKKLNAKESDDFDKKIIQLVYQAQEYDLIEKKLFTAEEALLKLNALIFDFKEDKISTDVSEIENLYRERRIVGRKIRNLRSFDEEYIRYKENLKADKDSLKPIEYIKENFSEIITIPEIKSFVEGLNIELSNIQAGIDKKKPFSTDIKKEIAELVSKYQQLTRQINEFPIQTKDFEGNVTKFIFIGELRAKLSFYSKEWENDDYDEQIVNFENEYASLEEKLTSNADKRSILLQDLHDRVQAYIANCDSFGIYKSYKAYINYQKKILQVREPNAKNPANIGSSSNHMFLHLFLFLGLHEHFIREKVPFIPQFLIFDQLSQPYYEEAKKNGFENIEDDDKAKLTEAFKMLNDFIDLIKNELKDEFQFILLEHASREYWEDAGLEHFHLVEEFRNGNALIQ